VKTIMRRRFLWNL